MERKDKRMHPEDVGAGSNGGKRRRHNNGRGYFML
jgi:hypothetical protein